MSEKTHIADELKHLHKLDGHHDKESQHAAMRELSHIRGELKSEHARDPKGFSKTMSEINGMLPSGEHLGIERHNGEVTHINFDHHNLYTSQHKSAEQRRKEHDREAIRKIHGSGEPTPREPSVTRPDGPQSEAAIEGAGEKARRAKVDEAARAEQHTRDTEIQQRVANGGREGYERVLRDAHERARAARQAEADTRFH